MVAAAVIGGAVVGSVGSAVVQSKAASKAGAAQERAAELGVTEQRAAREELRKLLEPYVAAGGTGLDAYMGAIGLGTPEEQQAFIAQQEQSPIFQALARQGEEAILQRASATGGLRGGNVQGALAQFRPALLNQFLTDQYSRLGGLAELGQRSAAGVGSAGMTTASNIGNLYGQVGAAQAGTALAKGQAFGNAFSGIGQAFGTAAGLGAFGGGGMSAPTFNYGSGGMLTGSNVPQF